MEGYASTYMSFLRGKAPASGKYKSGSGNFLLLGCLLFVVLGFIRYVSWQVHIYQFMFRWDPCIKVYNRFLRGYGKCIPTR